MPELPDVVVYVEALERLLADLPKLHRGVRFWLVHVAEMVRDQEVRLQLKGMLAAADTERVLQTELMRRRTALKKSWTPSTTSVAMRISVT